MKLERLASFGVSMLGVVLVGLATPGWAHHSTTMFEPNKTIAIEGTITEVAWGNPHSVFFVDAKPVGQEAPIKNWTVEAPNPRQMTSMGWQQDTLKAGDKVKVTGFQRKDGKAQMLFIELTDEKGHRFATKRGDYAGD